MLSVAEVAERLGCSPDTVQRLIAAGELPAYRIGGRLKVNEADLAEYLNRARVATK
jgi:excisionase family DNA binding protein